MHEISAQRAASGIVFRGGFGMPCAEHPTKDAGIVEADRCLSGPQ